MWPAPIGTKYLLITASQFDKRGGHYINLGSMTNGKYREKCLGGGCDACEGKGLVSRDSGRERDETSPP